jgi:SAM-dependent methyltransferase
MAAGAGLIAPPRPSFHEGTPTFNSDLPEGWLTEAEAAILQELAAGKVVLEIGSWLGRSTVALARVAEHVVAVDHHRGSPEHGPNVDTLPGFLANLDRHGVRAKVSVCVMNSTSLALFKSSSFDLIFVDGAHDFGSVMRDGKAAVRLRKEGASIVFHDYAPGWKSVMAAVDSIQQIYPYLRFQRQGALAILYV